MTAPEDVILIVTELAESYDKRLSAATLAAFAADLQAYDIDDLKAVQADLRRTSVKWPRTAEWCERLKARIAARPSPSLVRGEKPHCAYCDDTGWRKTIKLCPGKRDWTCKFRIPHEPHRWEVATPCECRKSNPNYRHSTPRI